MWLRPSAVQSRRKESGSRVRSTKWKPKTLLRGIWIFRQMTTKDWLMTAALFLPAMMLPAGLIAQGTPPAPGIIWQPRRAQALAKKSAAKPYDNVAHVPDKICTLAELIDLAEQYNPETRVAWQEAKSKADELGIVRSSLYPTLTAVALAVSLRTATLIGQYFHRQAQGVFEPILHMEYLVFDVGGRSGEIDVAKANLLASDLAFNDTHRRIIFQVAEAYYRLLNAQGLRQAAESSLENAKAAEEDAKARLENGLATKPNELEATAARAQADFDLQAAVGAVDIARGDLATALGVDPGTVFTVEGIDQLRLPSSIANSVDQEIDPAFSQRPDLLQQLARLRAANTAIEQVRSQYFPSLSFKGDGGLRGHSDSRIFFPEATHKVRFGTPNSNCDGISSMARAANIVLRELSPTKRQHRPRSMRSATRSPTRLGRLHQHANRSPPAGGLRKCIGIYRLFGSRPLGRIPEIGMMCGSPIRTILGPAVIWKR